MELFTTLFASWPPQTLIQRVSFTARQHCKALASSVTSHQRCRQHYRGQCGDNKTAVLVKEAGLSNRTSSQNSNIQGYSSAYVTHQSTIGRYQFYDAMIWGSRAVVQRTEVATQQGTSNRDQERKNYVLALSGRTSSLPALWRVLGVKCNMRTVCVRNAFS